MNPHRSSISRFPSDLAALLALPCVLLLVGLSSSLIVSAFGKSLASGEPSVLWWGIAIGGVGSVLLFLARLPLYRQGKFLQIGPRGLDGRHRRLYRCAWWMIGVSIGLLGLFAICLGLI